MREAAYIVLLLVGSLLVAGSFVRNERGSALAVGLAKSFIGFVAVCYAETCLAGLGAVSVERFLSTASVPLTVVTALALGCWPILTRRAAALLRLRSRSHTRTSLLTAAQICLLIAIALELTLANLNHYGTAFGGDRVDLNSGKVSAQSLDRGPDGLYIPSDKKASITFSDLHTRVSSVHIDAVFPGDTAVQSFSFGYDDGSLSGGGTATFDVVKSVPQTQYRATQFLGTVTSLTLRYEGDNANAQLRNVTINAPIPLWVNYWRIAVGFLILLGAWSFVRYKWYRVVTDFGSPRQRLVSGGAAAALAALAVFTVFSSVDPANPDFDDSSRGWHSQMSTLVVEALLDGHVYLNIDPSSSLLNEKNPYDPIQRSRDHVDYYWDLSYHEGRYYSYFGIVPSLILFLPYKVLTGNYLDTYYGQAIFCLLALFALLALWTRVVRLFLPRMPYLMYLLGLLTIGLGSMVIYVGRRPAFYETAIAAAAFFIALGMWFLLGGAAGHRPSYWRIAAGTGSLALAVGCRPNLVIVSIVVPVIAAPLIARLRRQQRRISPLILAVAIPYLPVAALLMWYNWARYGSILDFGASYQLTVANIGAYTQINPAGKLYKALIGVRYFFFSPPHLQTTFPFVLNNRGDGPDLLGYYFYEGTIGVMWMPVCLVLLAAPWLRQKVRDTSPMLWQLMLWLIGAAVVIAAVISISGGISSRYATDFAWMVVLPALILIYFLWQRFEQNAAAQGVVLAVSSLALGATIVMQGLLTLTAESNFMQIYNPVVYAHLESFFALLN